MFCNEKFKIVFYILMLAQSSSYIKTEDLALQYEVQEKIKKGIPQWMLNQIKKDLSYVPKSGITKDMMSRTLEQDPMHLVLFKIKNGTIAVEYNNQMEMRWQNFTCDPIIAALSELSTYITLPDVEFVFSLDDAPFNWFGSGKTGTLIEPSTYRAPIFSACKIPEDVNVILVPDSHTLSSIKNNVIQEIALGNTTFRWDTKKNMAFWRGATTGGRFKLNNFEQFPRTKLAKLSVEFPKVLDAKFTFFWGIDDDETKNKLKELYYLAETTSISDHIQYKYQILIDGNSASWPRAYWQYQCNSVVFKQNSPYIVWHNDLFKPWVHYIPFNHNCDDLIDKIKWAINNDDNAQRIAHNANEIANACLKHSDILVYIYAAINEYAKLQASD